MEEVLKPPKASAPASVRRYLPLGLNEAEALSQGKPPSRPLYHGHLWPVCSWEGHYKRTNKPVRFVVGILQFPQRLSFQEIKHVLTCPFLSRIQTLGTASKEAQ